MLGPWRISSALKITTTTVAVVFSIALQLEGDQYNPKKKLFFDFQDDIDSLIDVKAIHLALLHIQIKGCLKVPKCEILMSWILMIFLSWSLYR